MSSFGGFDPLEGLERRSKDEQVAVLANEVRNQRNMLAEVKKEMEGLRRSLWALIATIVIGVVVFQITGAHKTPGSVVPPAPAAKVAQVK